MIEWWTYRLDDFLMFAPRTYYRLGELHNAAAWPAQVLGTGLGLLATGLLLKGHARPGCALAAAGWAAVAWFYHLQRYAEINWAAPGFAALFALQALLLAAAAFGARPLPPGTPGWRRPAGLGLLLFALLVQPGIGLLQGRPWTQAECAGLHPDPTVLATLGLLLVLQPTRPRLPGRLLWLVPLLWCLGSAATLSSMGVAEAWLMAAAPLLALAAARSAPGRG